MRFLADENFNGAILRGLRRQKPDVDVIRVQDTELFHADDPTILAWAADVDRILLTHDVETMVGLAYERVALGLPMPGVFELHDKVPIGQAIRSLMLVIDASKVEEWRDKISYLPFR
jgi:hypothetical protein